MNLLGKKSLHHPNHYYNIYIYIYIYMTFSMQGKGTYSSNNRQKKLLCKKKYGNKESKRPT